MDRNETIKAIKTSLQKRSGKQWSVTGGRGTAWGWITISVPPKRLGCDRKHNFATHPYNDCADCGGNRFHDGYSGCPSHVCTDKCYMGELTPEDQKELAELLGLRDVHMQGVSIASSNGHYQEYMDRAAG